jgi:hypothetical protein
MPVTSVPKPEVALELLDRAIELYLRGDSYYAALHLGGAAEEVLSVCAREVSVNSTATLKPAFDQMKDAIVALSAPASPDEKRKAEKRVYDLMSDAKNTVKHKRGSKDNTVNFDAKEEAYDVIDRAITTYLQLLSLLRLAHLPSIQKFDERRRSEGDA